MIVCCGEALIDFVPTVDVDGLPGYRPCIGGSPYNVAIASARLEVPTGFLARLSTDFFGDMLVGGLRANGIDDRYVCRSPQPSTLAFVSVAQDEEPQFAFYADNAADRSLAEADLPDALPDEIACLQFGSISLMQEPTASTLEVLMRRESGRRILSLDPNVRPGIIQNKATWTHRLENWIPLVDIVKVSAADLRWLFPDDTLHTTAARWLALGPALVVVTRGARGSLALTRHHRVDRIGHAVEVIDTVGAGDTFHAGLLASLREQGLLHSSRLADATEAALATALDWGSRAAAANCARPGADPPRRSDLD